MMPGAESSNITFSGYFGRIDTGVTPALWAQLLTSRNVDKIGHF